MIFFGERPLIDLEVERRMQARHRSPAPRRISPESPVRGQGKFRYYSNHRNFRRRSDHPKRCSDPPPQKPDVWIEAGRLAAEYLVSKGLLSPSLLPENLPKKEDNRELKEKERNSPVPESRTSAFARLGNTSPEVDHGKRWRRNDDENDRMGSWNYSRRRRMGRYDRGQGSNWPRDNVRNARWIERSGKYSDSVDKDNDFSPCIHRSWGSGFDKGRSSVMRSSADEGYSRSDHISESRSEREGFDENRSKLSSSRSRRDRPVVSRRDLNEGDDDGAVLKSVNVELKSDLSWKLKEKDLAVEDRSLRIDDNNLWNKISSLKVPKKPRSSVPPKCPKFDQIDHGPTAKAKITLQDSAKEAFKMDLEEDLDTNKIKSSNSQVPDHLFVQSVQAMEESANLQYESSERPQDLGTFGPIVDAREDVNFVRYSIETERIKQQGYSTPSRIAKENEQLCLSAKLSNLYDEKLSLDKEMVDVAEQEILVDPLLLPKDKAEVDAMLGEEKQLPCTSFRNFDLNIVGTPEITEITNDSIGDQLHSSLPILETEKKLPAYPDFLMGRSNAENEHKQLVNNDKVIQVINLEDVSLAEDNVCNHLKSTSETIYLGLNNFQSHTERADLSGIRDGCPFSIPNYLATVTSGRRPMQANLSNLQKEMSPHDAVAIPVEDDPIYISLEEIPFGYVEALD